MATLLDRDALQDRLPDPKLLDNFSDGYLDIALADNQDAIVQYLSYDPTLTYHVGEEGVAELEQQGDYIGSYALDLDGRPVCQVVGLSMTYPSYYLQNSSVDVTRLLVDKTTGELFVPLQLVTGGLIGGGVGVAAVGYRADYVAGYKTGIHDPVPSGGGTGFAGTLAVAGGSINAAVVTSPGAGYKTPPILVVSGGGGVGSLIRPVLADDGTVASLEIVSGGAGFQSAPALSVSTVPSFPAPPAPSSLKRALAFLVQEQLELANPKGASAKIPKPLGSGGVKSLRTMSSLITYQDTAKSTGKNEIGMGTALADEAKKLLSRFKRTRVITLI